MTQIEVAEDVDALSRMVAQHFVVHTTNAIDARGRCAVALSGGSTPRAIYRLLGTPAFRDRVRWADIHFFWGDERHVPPDYPDSNYRMAAEAMLSNVPVPSANVHRIRAELPDADQAARDYEAEIRRWFSGGAIPRFDLVHLGVGTDGHTASLFPESEALGETERVCVGNWVAKLGAFRITLTFPVLNAARAVVFVAAGQEKAPIVRRILQEPNVSPPLPAQLIRPTDGELWWMLDRAAAGRV